MKQESILEEVVINLTIVTECLDTDTSCGICRRLHWKNQYNFL